MIAGQGQALFTAECSHVFHFNCIASNVHHGNHICPTCRATWQHLPFQAPPPANNPLRNFPPTSSTFLPQQPISPLITGNFADDEPLPSIPAPTTASEAAPIPSSNPWSESRSITIKALPEYRALSRSQKSEAFPVLIGIHAPSFSPEASDHPDSRAPLDLVAVLDVSGSMHGDKIRLLKQAVNFIVDNLGPTDRLSIITFSTSARRVTPLRRMTEVGQAETSHIVNLIQVNGATNIIAGLRMAVQVLEQRRQKNPVSRIILLSDGQDNQNGHSEGFLRALQHLPACIRSRDIENLTQTDVVPVHTFGFGYDHDATALHAIADRSGGSFSYIESIEVIQDAFAQCIGGLLSVVAQEVEISVQSGSLGVRILSIPSGRYRNIVDSNAGRHGVIYVGDLYAEEEKQFLVYLLVPEASSSSDEEATVTTCLLHVRCSCKDPLSNENLVSEIKIVEIERPPTEALSEADRKVCLEVDRERNRVSVAEGIAQAQAMAERGELDSARSLLSQQRTTLLSSVAAQSGDKVCNLLENEVNEIQRRMSSTAAYESGGRAYTLSRKSAHMYQRATTQAVQKPQQSLQNAIPLTFGVASSFSSPASAAVPQAMGYQTPLMMKMVAKSQMLRQSTTQDDDEANKSSNSKSKSSKP